MITAAALALTLLVQPRDSIGRSTPSKYDLQMSPSVKVLPFAALPTAAGVLGGGLGLSPGRVDTGYRIERDKSPAWSAASDPSRSTTARPGFFRRHPALTAFVVGAGIGAVIESFQHQDGRRVVVVAAPKRRCDGDDN